MSFSSELKDHLTVAAITGYVNDRIYPLLRDEGAALPAVVYTIVSLDPQGNLDGIDGSQRQYRVQIDCWSRTYDEMDLLALAVRDRMNTAATNFKTVFQPGSGFDEYESETKLYRRSADYSCWFKEVP